MRQGGVTVSASALFSLACRALESAGAIKDVSEFIGYDIRPALELIAGLLPISSVVVIVPAGLFLYFAPSLARWKRRGKTEEQIEDTQLQVEKFRVENQLKQLKEAEKGKTQLNESTSFTIPVEESNYFEDDQRAAIEKTPYWMPSIVDQIIILDMNADSIAQRLRSTKNSMPKTVVDYILQNPRRIPKQEFLNAWCCALMLPPGYFQNGPLHKYGAQLSRSRLEYIRGCRHAPHHLLTGATQNATDAEIKDILKVVESAILHMHRTKPKGVNE